jgi:creatinine amidohydrolase
MPHYKEMTWKDIESFIEQQSRNATMLVPIGFLEEHGPHLPLATDSYLASAFSAALLKKLHIPIIIGPVVDFGVSVLTQGFPGTMKIDFKTLYRLLKNILASCESWGLQKVILWTWHGGSSHYICLREAALDIIRLHPNLKVYILRGVKLFDDDSFTIKIKSLLESDGDHADELETSLMLYTYPDLVVKDKIVKE